jgi:hypothetical protein
MASITVVLAAAAVLYPAIGSGRRAANVAVCLNNLQTITATSAFYSKDNERPGGRGGPTQPWWVDAREYTFTYISEYVYGGYQPQIDNPHYPDSDTYLIPTERRPYNKYIAPAVSGRFAIRDYICPADKSCATPLIGSGGIPPVVEERFSSWEANGNSYAINWYWTNGAPGGGYVGTLYDNPATPKYECNMNDFGGAMLQKKVGGAAAEFVLFTEGMMNAYMYDARPPGYQPPSALQMLQVGWHGKLSMYSMGFYDGHAEYRYLDTRYSSGPGYDTWPEPDTTWPTCP